MNVPGRCPYPQLLRDHRHDAERFQMIQQGAVAVLREP